MSIRLMLALVCFVPSAMAFQCFQNFNNLNMPEGTRNDTSITCLAGVTTCFKTLDLTNRVYNKGCGTAWQNCTNTLNPGLGPQASLCYNQTVSTTICCCNTENCNPAAPIGLNVVFGSVAALFLAKLF